MKSSLIAVTTMCFVLITGSGALEIIKEYFPTEALVGEDVMLSCLLSDVALPLNLETVIIHWTWKSHDGTLHVVYKFERLTHREIRPGSKMADSDILKGNASLYLPHVQVSDEGEYRCRVFVFPDRDSATCTLLVSGKPQVALTDSVAVGIGSERSVTCNLTQFYPKDVTVRWVKQSKLMGTSSSLEEDAYSNAPNNNSDGTFNMSSLLTVRPFSIEETGDEYFCIVSHRSLKTNTVRSFTLLVEESGLSTAVIVITCVLLLLAVTTALMVWLYFKKKSVTISEILGVACLYHMEKTTVAYEIDTKPEHIQFNIYLKGRNDVRKQLIYSCKYKEQSPEYSGATPESQEGIPLSSLLSPMEMKVEIEDWGNCCRCFIDITPDADTDDGAELTLEVKLPDLLWPVSTHRNLRVIKGNPEMTMMIERGEGESDVRIICKVKWAHPDKLMIAWKKDDPNQEPIACRCFQRTFYTVDGVQHHIEHITPSTDPVGFSSVLTFNNHSHQWDNTCFYCVIGTYRTKGKTESILFIG